MTHQTEPAPAPLQSFLEGHLDAAGLQRLCDDILLHARVVRCRNKGGAASMSSESDGDVREAFGLLAAGQVRALQIQYAVEGVLWSDTLVHHGGSTRLVRTKLEA